QRGAAAGQLTSLVHRLVTDVALRSSMAAALERWDAPHAAGQIADRIVDTVEALSRGAWKRPVANRSGSSDHRPSLPIRASASLPVGRATLLRRVRSRAVAYPG